MTAGISFSLSSITVAEADTAAPLLESFIGQVRDVYQALGLFGPEHCLAVPEEGLNFKEKILVMRPDVMREDHWSPKYQLWYAWGGFGCSPGSLGRAVFATCLGNGEEARCNRDDFTGVLDERYLPDWALEKLTKLQVQSQISEYH